MSRIYGKICSKNPLDTNRLFLPPTMVLFFLSSIFWLHKAYYQESKRWYEKQFWLFPKVHFSSPILPHRNHSSNKQISNFIPCNSVSLLNIHFHKCLKLDWACSLQVNNFTQSVPLRLRIWEQSSDGLGK